MQTVVPTSAREPWSRSIATKTRCQNDSVERLNFVVLSGAVEGPWTERWVIDMALARGRGVGKEQHKGFTCSDFEKSDDDSFASFFLLNSVAFLQDD